MSRSKWIFVLVCIVLLVLMGIVLFVLLSPGNDWTMYGSFFENGEETRCTFPFRYTFSGQPDESKYMTMSLDFPDSVPYRIPEDTELTRLEVLNDEVHYFIGTHYSYSIKEDEMVFYRFALDAEKGYMIILWDGEPGDMLLVSRDPNTTAQEIMDHFNSFIKLFGNK